MGISVRDHTAQVGSETDAREDHSNDACPSVKRDPHIRGQDPSGNDFDDHHGEAGKEDNEASFEAFSLHPKLPVI
jgi:hypothetical protein